jgi:hypothetical protein
MKSRNFEMGRPPERADPFFSDLRIKSPRVSSEGLSRFFHFSGVPSEEKENAEPGAAPAFRKKFGIFPHCMIKTNIPILEGTG